MNTTEIKTDGQLAAESIRSLSVYELARLADCEAPNDSRSNGADFLTRIAESVAEIAESDYTCDTWEIADGSVNVYTHQMFLEFIDVCAYREDVSDFGHRDFVEMAQAAMYQIAERLTRALADEYEIGGIE